MRNKHLLNSILQNTSCPKGFWGRMILWGMNRFHASLARRGMKQVNWQPQLDCPRYWMRRWSQPESFVETMSSRKRFMV